MQKSYLIFQFFRFLSSRASGLGLISGFSVCLTVLFHGTSSQGQSVKILNTYLKYYLLIYIFADESKSENERRKGFLTSLPTTKEHLQLFTICNLLNLFGEGLKRHFYQSKNCFPLNCISIYTCGIYSG